MAINSELEILEDTVRRVAHEQPLYRETTKAQLFKAADSIHKLRIAGEEILQTMAASSTGQAYALRLLREALGVVPHE